LVKNTDRLSELIKRLTNTATLILAITSTQSFYPIEIGSKSIMLRELMKVW